MPITAEASPDSSNFSICRPEATGRAVPDVAGQGALDRGRSTAGPGLDEWLSA
jgi:hypothetical protein